jgi:hypothetical protein
MDKTNNDSLNYANDKAVLSIIKNGINLITNRHYTIFRSNY